MTIADLIKSFVDSSKERIKNPILGAFILSFIIFNWKAILFLFFSTATIEDKLYLISLKYSSFYSLLIPFIISIVYSIAIPKLTLIIEDINKKTKQKRQENLYGEKKDEVKLKLDLADQELKLQDKLSRNQEIKDMLDKIENLENTIKLKDESQKAIEDDYRNQITDLITRLNNSNSSQEERDNQLKKLRIQVEELKNKSKHFLKELYNELSIEDQNQILSLNPNLTVDTRNFSLEALQILVNNNFIKMTNSNQYVLTDLGLNFKRFVHDINGLT
jgi:hypothetical protein